MTTTMHGADIGELRTLGGQFASGATTFQDIASRLTAQVAQTQAWKGRDADQFRSNWESDIRPTLVRASETMTDARDVLERNADEQEVASEAGGGSTGGPGGESGPPGVCTPKPSGPIGEGKEGSWWDDLWSTIKDAFPIVKGIVTAITKSALAIKLLKAGAWTLDKVDDILSSGMFRKGAAWLDDALKGVGKFGPMLGKFATFAAKAAPVLSIVSGAWGMFNPEHDGWRGWGDRISGGLSLAGGIMLFTPAAPIGAALLAVSAIWDVGNLIVDEWDTIKGWGNDIKDFAVDAFEGGKNVAQDLWDGAKGIWNGVFG